MSSSIVTSSSIASSSARGSSMCGGSRGVLSRSATRPYRPSTGTGGGAGGVGGGGGGGGGRISGIVRAVSLGTDVGTMAVPVLGKQQFQQKSGGTTPGGNKSTSPIHGADGPGIRTEPFTRASAAAYVQRFHSPQVASPAPPAAAAGAGAGGAGTAGGIADTPPRTHVRRRSADLRSNLSLSHSASVPDGSTDATDLKHPARTGGSGPIMPRLPASASVPSGRGGGAGGAGAGGGSTTSSPGRDWSEQLSVTDSPFLPGSSCFDLTACPSLALEWNDLFFAVQDAMAAYDTLLLAPLTTGALPRGSEVKELQQMADELAGMARDRMNGSDEGNARRCPLLLVRLFALRVKQETQQLLTVFPEAKDEEQQTQEEGAKGEEGETKAEGAAGVVEQAAEGEGEGGAERVAGAATENGASEYFKTRKLQQQQQQQLSGKQQQTAEKRQQQQQQQVQQVQQLQHLQQQAASSLLTEISNEIEEVFSACKGSLYGLGITHARSLSRLSLLGKAVRAAAEGAGEEDLTVLRDNQELGGVQRKVGGEAVGAAGEGVSVCRDGQGEAVSGVGGGGGRREVPLLVCPQNDWARLSAECDNNEGGALKEVIVWEDGMGELRNLFKSAAAATAAAAAAATAAPSPAGAAAGGGFSSGMLSGKEEGEDEGSREVSPRSPRGPLARDDESRKSSSGGSTAGRPAAASRSSTYHGASLSIAQGGSRPTQRLCSQILLDRISDLICAGHHAS
ncbi:unnamed protein product [Closterium sp. NIES-54]